MADWIFLSSLLTLTTDLLPARLFYSFSLTILGEMQIWFETFPSTNSLHCSRESPVSMPLILKKHISCSLLTCFLKTGRKKPSRVLVVDRQVWPFALLHAHTGSRVRKFWQDLWENDFLQLDSDLLEWKWQKKQNKTKKWFHLLSVLHSHCLFFFLSFTPCKTIRSPCTFKCPFVICFLCNTK